MNHLSLPWLLARLLLHYHLSTQLVWWNSSYTLPSLRFLRFCHSTDYLLVLYISGTPALRLNCWNVKHWCFSRTGSGTATTGSSTNLGRATSVNLNPLTLEGMCLTSWTLTLASGVPPKTPTPTTAFPATISGWVSMTSALVDPVVFIEFCTKALITDTVNTKVNSMMYHTASLEQKKNAFRLSSVFKIMTLDYKIYEISNLESGENRYRSNTWLFGNEYQTGCCELSGITFVVELVEGKDRPRQMGYLTHDEHEKKVACSSISHSLFEAQTKLLPETVAFAC